MLPCCAGEGAEATEQALSISPLEMARSLLPLLCRALRVHTDILLISFLLQLLWLLWE